MGPRENHHVRFGSRLPCEPLCSAALHALKHTLPSQGEVVAQHFLRQDDVELARTLELPSPWETPIHLDAAEEDGALEEEGEEEEGKEPLPSHREDTTPQQRMPMQVAGGAGSFGSQSVIPAILPRAVARRMTPGGATRAHMAAKAAKLLPVDDSSPHEQVSSKVPDAEHTRRSISPLRPSDVFFGGSLLFRLTFEARCQGRRLEAT
jgi:hypothetical protein